MLKNNLENDGYRRCRQTNCAFFINGGCKACRSCSTKSFVIKKDCDICYRCENIPNNTRFDDPDITKLLQSEKPIPTPIIESEQPPQEKEIIEIIERGK